MPFEWGFPELAGRINAFDLKALREQRSVAEPVAAAVGRSLGCVKTTKSSKGQSALTGRACVDPIVLGAAHFRVPLLARGKRRERLERWFGEGLAG